MQKVDPEARGHTNATTEIQGAPSKALIGLKGGGGWRETKQENSSGTNIPRNGCLSESRASRAQEMSRA